MKTIIIADDHPALLKGIKSILRLPFPDARIIDCDDGYRAVEECETHKPDYAILDLSMARLNGIQATRRIHVLSPRTKIILLSQYIDVEYIHNAIEAGAVAYLSKLDSIDHLQSCLETIKNNRIYISPLISEVLLSVSMPSVSVLTSREKEITQMLEQGFNVSEIAKELRLSKRTIGQHKSNMFHKLRISDQDELIKYAIKKKFIVPSS